MEEQGLACMEVWGGNAPIETGVSLTGLDTWVCARPHEDADTGGDVYYLSSCATGRITRLLLADVAGHGPSASDTSITLRDLMRAYVNYVDQTRFVAAMNTRFVRLSNDGLFATAVVATYWAPNAQLVLCNAGHPAPLVYRASSGEWSAIKRDASAGLGLVNLPLGVLDETSYEQVALELEPGDAVIIYTDALVEARTGDGKQLGSDGLLGIVRELDASKPESLARDLYAHVRERTGDIDDDATVMVLSPRPMKIPMRRNLAAPFRIAKSVASGLARKGRPEGWPQMTAANILGAVVPSLNKRWSPGGSALRGDHDAT